MTNLISHPFRLDGAGNVVTRDDGDDQFLAEQIAVLILTVPGERPLVPEFGVDDPVFEGLYQNIVTSAVEQFGPAVTIVSVDTTSISDSAQNVNVTFTPDDEIEGIDDNQS